MKTPIAAPNLRQGYPRRAEQFEMRLARIREHARTNSMMLRIPGIAASECKLAVLSYYGGYFRTVVALAREGFLLWRHGLWTSALMSICDRVGWTNVYDVPETSVMRGYKMRHGRKCSGSPNCNNMNCIEDSVPKWFRVLTRWED